jgi:urease accessory protein
MLELTLWQLADSGLPSGGFVHSGGLEAAVQMGEVADRDGLARFVAEIVAQAGRGALPLVTAAHGGTGALDDLDALAEAFLVNPVANRASRAQGRAFLETCAATFPHPGLRALREDVRRRRLCAHHAPIFGAAAGALGIDRVQAQRLFLVLTSRGVLTAAVRLGLVGVYDAQRLQYAAGPLIERTRERCADLGPLDIAQTAPLADLYQSTQDRLYSRLFQS